MVGCAPCVRRFSYGVGVMVMERVPFISSDYMCFASAKYAQWLVGVFTRGNALVHALLRVNG